MEDIQSKSEWIAQRRARKRKGSMFAEEVSISLLSHPGIHTPPMHGKLADPRFFPPQMEILAQDRSADSSGDSVCEPLTKRPASRAETFVSYASSEDTVN